ncbi:peptidase, U32 family [Bacteriovorax sp. BSW11_IV]|uniref:U32 family peptidase n=1 Tax=Bacteriovorax sp. BSW11_IV TaxID=1353529 RepID=UPI00038A1218|nr:U32 family peptidase [Bacteriovorax sp. BSW11_IV]EQC49345.1 peptidase, U32 family [Bacteriovorax sp. BSW11_IV]
MSDRWVPELLAPAGNLEKLKVAILYGANAVYLGGQKFGLRSAADNFTLEELVEGVEFAHARNAKVYVVLNSFLHDKEIDELPEFLKFLDEVNVDAVIVSDLGVISTVTENSNLEVHLSTQASCLNVEAAKLWAKMGVKRVVLGREVSVKEAAKIKKESGLEVEMFIHGSMCMAYSGNCVISNYTQGRDSNRGGCAHSCRFEYGLDFSDDQRAKAQDIKAYFMSSKDLEGIRVLEEFIEGEIDSLKVEGRMKSHHYVGTISKVYSDALNFYKEHGHLLSEDIKEWETELRKITHRDYTLASLVEPAGADSIYTEREHDDNEYVVAGVILDVVKNDHMVLEVRSAFRPNDSLELVPFSGNARMFNVDFVTTIMDEPYEKTKPGYLVKVPYVDGAMQWNIVRAKCLAVAGV